MKPYQFFCYVAKYFKKLEQLEDKPTPERQAQVDRLRTAITDEINRVSTRLREKAERTLPHY